MLVCSKSTKRFFPEEKEIRLVTSAPTVEILNEVSKYNSVIAVGGGAVIDTAKILAKEVICFPTTAAGSSSTSHSVYWEGTLKKSIKRKVPKEVNIFKEYIKDLPEEVKEYTTYDVISHCLDSMWSVYSTKNSLYYIKQALEILEGDYSNSELIEAGNIAGCAIELCPTTLLHSLSYPLTGFYGISHGKALGFLLPVICEYMGVDLNKYINYPKVKLQNINLDIIFDEAIKYGKVDNIKKKIDLIEIKKMMFKKER